MGVIWRARRSIVLCPLIVGALHQSCQKHENTIFTTTKKLMCRNSISTIWWGLLSHSRLHSIVQKTCIFLMEYASRSRLWQTIYFSQMTSLDDGLTTVFLHGSVFSPASSHSRSIVSISWGGSGLWLPLKVFVLHFFAIVNLAPMLSRTRSFRFVKKHMKKSHSMSSLEAKSLMRHTSFEKPPLFNVSVHIIRSVASISRVYVEHEAYIFDVGAT